MADLVLSPPPVPATVSSALPLPPADLALSSPPGLNAARSALPLSPTELDLLRTTLIGLTGPQGVPGPPGPPGIAGGSVAAATFTFATPSLTWTAVHNLGFTPAVGTYDPLGQQIGSLVTANDAVHTVVTYYLPAAGRMTLS